MPKQESPADAMRRQRTRLQTEIAPDAITALWEVARDKAAPPAARATAGTTLIRAAGFFDRSEAGKLEKEIHEMTLEELDARRRELQAGGAPRLAGSAGPGVSGEDPPTVFD
jgi:hypothetical protein